MLTFVTFKLLYLWAVVHTSSQYSTEGQASYDWTAHTLGNVFSRYSCSSPKTSQRLSSPTGARSSYDTVLRHRVRFGLDNPMIESQHPRNLYSAA